MRLDKAKDREYKNNWAKQNKEKCRLAVQRYLYNGNTCVDCGSLIDRRGTRCGNCQNKGCRSHFWKGGITPLRDWIRKTIVYDKWVEQVFKRDTYTCQSCFKRSGEKHAHHIYSFKNLLQDFLNEYSQFSPIDDIETLVRLTESYKPFWDINNGITLCPECHKVGVHQWKTKK
jgi:hypothetical protein